MLLAYNSGDEAPGETKAILRTLWQDPKQLIVAAPLVAANGLAACGPYSLPDSMLARKNMFNLSENGIGTMFKVANGAMGGAINTIYTIPRAIDTTQPLPPVKEVTVDDLVEKLENPKHRINHHDAQMLVVTTQGLFAPKLSENVREERAGLHKGYSAPGAV